MKNFLENILDISSIIRSGYFIYQTAKFFSRNKYYYLPYNYRIEKLIPKTISSKINNSAFGLQLRSNDPIEDRYSLKQFSLENQNNALFMSVYDGHGGYSLSEYANNHLFNYFIDSYNELPKHLSTDEKIKNAILKAFLRIEKEFYDISYEKYLRGEGREATLGSCALIGIIYDNKLYISNLGDSKARMFSLPKNSENFLVNKLTKVFNARKKEEQERLIKIWPNDPIIYKCHKNNPKACYVKGRLQPTRTLGDFHLKFKEFNEHTQTKENKEKYKKEIKDFDGPYINHIPEIKIINLNENDKYILMASDGLWDFLKSSEVSKIIRNYEKEKIFNINLEKISYKLLDKILIRASQDAGISFDEMLEIKEAKKLRKIHDDITMILCSLNKFKI